jgi:hypothetical protein
MVPLFLRKKPIDIEQQQTKQTTTTTTEKVPKKHLKTSMSVVEDLFTTIDLTRQRCVCVCIFAIATKCSGIIAFRRRRRLDIL